MILTHHPSIVHVFWDRLISMNSIPVLICEAHYIVDSDWMIGRQLCSISNKCHAPCWVPALSIQMAGVDVKESYCVTVMNSDESVTKGWVI